MRFPDGIFHGAVWDWRFLSEQLGIPEEDCAKLGDLGLPYGGYSDGHQLIFHHVPLNEAMRFLQEHVHELYEDDSKRDQVIADRKRSDREQGGHWNEDHMWVDASGFIDGSRSPKRFGLF